MIAMSRQAKSTEGRYSSSFHVEVQIGIDGRWVRQEGSGPDRRSYALGFAHGMACYYPHPALRVVCSEDGRVIWECGAASVPHV